MEDERCSSSPTFNSFWYFYTSSRNSIHPPTPIVRHNFKSIDELLSQKADDTGYNSQLSVSFQSQENDENVKPTPIHKSIKKIRTVFTDHQKQYLDQYYSTNRYPDPTQMEFLCSLLSLKEKVIRVWFQNKRSRGKHHRTSLCCSFE